MSRPSFSPPAELRCLAWSLAGVGGAALILGLLAAPAAAWANLLLLSFLLICLGLAGPVFVSLQYVTGAGWGVGLRRIPEALTSLIPTAAVGLTAVFLLHPGLYPWFTREGHSHSAFRDAWLTWPFFLTRAAIYVFLWLVLSLPLLRHSRRQDIDGAAEHTYANTRWSALFLIVFALTFWLASSDWLMSLEPDWTSTIFGLYNFAGLFASGLALIVILTLWLGSAGPLRHVINDNHLHDLGKLLFAFSTFWMYIWFCQYMLIWYVDNPEETPYYLRRLQGDWEPLFWTNTALNWVFPFCLLLSARAKRRPKVLAAASGSILLGRWLDLVLMVQPEGDVLGGLVAIGMALGAAGICLLVIQAALRRVALVPVGDPFLMESVRRSQQQERASTGAC